MKPDILKIKTKKIAENILEINGYKKSFLKRTSYDYDKLKFFFFPY